MKNHSCSIELLVESVEKYGKTGLELYRLKAIDKSAEILSSLTSKVILVIYFTLVFIVLNTGIALWIGDLMGKSYLGFFAISAFYFITGIAIYFFRNRWIKTPIRNSFVINALN